MPESLMAAIVLGSSSRAVSASFERDIAALPIANSVGTAAITRLVNATEVVQATKAKRKKAWSLKLNLATDGDGTLGFPTSTFHGLCEASF